MIFLTGKDEIEAAHSHIRTLSQEFQTLTDRLLILPLYAGLSVEEQLCIFAPTPLNRFKIVLSTNIAEASVTIDGITSVIDCGFVKVEWVVACDLLSIH